jgi:CRP-like cAMP-binding protein
LKSPLFEGFSSNDVGSILAASTQRRFRADEVIFREGYPARSLFLLVGGRARYFCHTPDGQKMVLPWISPGEAFGIAALLSDSVAYVVGAETVTGSSILIWEGTHIRGLARRYPRLLENAFRIAADHMHWAIDAHIDLLSHSARERLAKALVNLARDVGVGGKDGIELDVTNEELAGVANVARFTASRLMSEWHRRGVLIKSRCKILLRFPKKLFTR